MAECHNKRARHRVERGRLSLTQTFPLRLVDSNVYPRKIYRITILLHLIIILATLQRAHATEAGASDADRLDSLLNANPAPNLVEDSIAEQHRFVAPDAQMPAAESGYLWGLPAAIGDAAAAFTYGGRGKQGSSVEGNGDFREPALYEAGFTGVLPSLLRRQDSGQIAMRNNAPILVNIVPGSTEHSVFLNESLWSEQNDRDDVELAEPASSDDEKRAVEIQGGESEEKDGSKLKKRQDGGERASRTIHISINTCLQPIGNASTSAEPPQLTLYVSTSRNNDLPGPSVTNLPQLVLPLDEGYAGVSVEATEDTFIGVHGPSLPESFSNPWNCEIAVSTDAPYHFFHDGNNRDPEDSDDDEDPRSLLFFVDGDARSALLVTDNLTEADAGSPEFERWAELDPPPYIIFAHNQNDTRTKGLRRSFCGLRNRAQISVDREGNTDRVERSMTLRGMGNKPKEQFLIEGLNSSSDYVAYLAMMGNSTAAGTGVVGGGGQVWPATSFFTKTDDNCQVIFNLGFCSDVAYAVPSNPQNFASMAELAQLYDDNAAAIYQNFSFSLQQVACDTSSTARYSLVRDCDDCARDYKNWLCAVTIPRCADFSSQDDFLQPRNLGQAFINGTESSDVGGRGTESAKKGNDSDESGSGSGEEEEGEEGDDSDGYEDTRPSTERLYSNSSRNPLIDEVIRPGPYKEVLPCDDLCYSLIQSCPAALGFKCPLPGRGLERSYGKRSRDGSITCSYLGAAYYLNDGGKSLLVGMVPSRVVLWFTSGVMGLMML